MKKTIWAIVIGGILLTAWIVIAGVAENDQRGRAIDAATEFHVDMEHNVAVSRQQLHASVCAVHVGNSSALKLHGCNRDGSIRQIINPDGTVSDAPDAR